MTRSSLLPLVLAMLLAACARVPLGPDVMVLPGNGKTFEQFNADDVTCRAWAARQTGTTPARAANESAVSGGAVGAVVGAATGAAIGAATGSPATGAAVGAGTGMLGGAVVGADRGEARRWSLQRRYDAAFMQCMYAKGHQIPVPRGMQPVYAPPAPAPMDTSIRSRRVPPPPPGPPPPAPPGVQ